MADESCPHIRIRTNELASGTTWTCEVCGAGFYPANALAALEATVDVVAGAMLQDLHARVVEHYGSGVKTLRAPEGACEPDQHEWDIDGYKCIHCGTPMLF